MEPKTRLSKENTSPLVDATFYRSLVGSVRYLVNTRLDVAFSVGCVSRFMQEPHVDHLAVVKHVLRFVSGTCDQGLFYQKGGSEEPSLVGYSDSDWAWDVDERKSTIRVIFFLNGGTVSWQSTKQRIVAMSSCEVEYVAAATASCQAVWLARLLSKILDREVERAVLTVDNKSAISIIRNPVLNDRSRHIDTRFHLIREHEVNGLVSVQFIGTNEQLGDILTKSLSRVKFLELSMKIGIHSVAG
jgi:hypothetical protein